MRIDQPTPAGRIQGSCDARFAELLETFHANFSNRNELGASVAVSLNGKPVVDLWGGHRDEAGTPWTENTTSIIWSATKGATALCAHMAAYRGLLDLDAPVARYWPEFAEAGKETATVAMMLDHSAGVPAFRGQLPAGAFYDYDATVARLAAEPPFWEPGTRNGYHAITFAWTVGEMVRRGTGKRLGQFFRDEVAAPLGLNFWIGRPATLTAPVAPIVLAPPNEAARNSRLAIAARANPTGPTGCFMANRAVYDVNAPACHAAEIGSISGITHARGLAALYAPLAMGGAIGGTRLVDADTLARATRVAVATHEDATLRIPTRFSLGFMRTIDNRHLANAANCSMLLSDTAFGHVGAGGSIGFADPACGLSFGYTMNRMGAGLFLNDRGQALVDAAYRALGYRSSASGAWTT